MQRDCLRVALVIAVLLSPLMTIDEVVAEGRSAINPAAAAKLLRKVVADPLRMEVEVMGEKKFYKGFPPREIYLEGTKRIEKLNLIVDVPGKPWAFFAPKQKGNISSIELKCKKPDIFIGLNAFRLSEDAFIDLAALVKSSQDQTKKLGGALMPDVWEVNANGIHGMMYEAFGQTKDEKVVHMSIWYGGRSGYLYEVRARGEDKASIEQAMSDFLSRIRFIERVDVTHPQRDRKVVRIDDQVSEAKETTQVVWSTDEEPEQRSSRAPVRSHSRQRKFRRR